MTATKACVQRVAGEAIQFASGEVARQAIGENIIGIEHLVFHGAVDTFLETRATGYFLDDVLEAIDLRITSLGGLGIGRFGKRGV